MNVGLMKKAWGDEVATVTPARYAMLLRSCTLCENVTNNEKHVQGIPRLEF